MVKKIAKELKTTVESLTSNQLFDTKEYFITIDVDNFDKPTDMTFPTLNDMKKYIQKIMKLLYSMIKPK